MLRGRGEKGVSPQLLGLGSLHDEPDAGYTMSVNGSTRCHTPAIRRAALLAVLTALMVAVAGAVRQWHQEVSVACMVGPGLSEQDARRICHLLSCRVAAEFAGPRGFAQTPLDAYERPSRPPDGRVLAYAINGKIMYVFVNAQRRVEAVFWARRVVPGRHRAPS